LTHLEVNPKKSMSPAAPKDLQAFSAEYIAHILAVRRRIGQEPGTLQLTRAIDLLDLELPAPVLSIYDCAAGGVDD
jgi:hypothetical protein